MDEVTRILSAIERGDEQAAEQLLPLVYEELRKLAVRKLAQEKPGHTLQATALVHEAYVRLERLTGLFLGEPLSGQPAQLVVYHGQQLVGGLRVALLDRREDVGDVVHAGCSPGPSGRVAARTDAGATTLRTDSDEADLGAEVRPPG